MCSSDLARDEIRLPLRVVRRGTSRSADLRVRGKDADRTLSAEDTEQAAKAGRSRDGNTESSHSRFPFILLAATAMAFSAHGRRASGSSRNSAGTW